MKIKELKDRPIDAVSRALHMLNLIYQVASRAKGQGEGFMWSFEMTGNSRLLGLSCHSHRISLKYKTLALIAHDQMLHSDKRLNIDAK